MSYAYLDISKGDTALGRVVIQLHPDLAPKLSENFLQLCKGEREINGLKASYKGNIFFRVIKNFMIQSGDNVFGTDSTYPDKDVGKGGISIYAEESSEMGPLNGVFEDENLVEFDTPMKVAMANLGANTNCSQFFISTYPLPHLNGKHTIFGEVIGGKSVVRDIEKSDTDKESDQPVEKIVITACGEWFKGDDIPVYNACYDTIGGDVYEEYLDDEDKIGESTPKAYEATETIKESLTLLFRQNEKAKALLKYLKLLRYCNELIPDQDSEPVYYQKFIDLKKKLFLNLSLVYLNLKQYDNSIKYCNYLIEMNDQLQMTDTEAAKTHFRKGTSLASLNRLDLAFTELQQAQQLLPEDKLISLEFHRLDTLLQNKKSKQKLNYSKFFQ